MTSSNRFKTLLALAVVAMAAGAFTTTSAQAAEIVDPGKIVGVPNFGITGTMVVIDVPFLGGTNVYPLNGGPNWTENVDNGFATVNAPIGLSDGTSNWEPDGTPINEALGQFAFGGGNPSVSWNFNLADSGIDIPDDAVINGIYATWNTRGSDGITWEYTEGAASDTFVHNQATGPNADLVLSWLDDINVSRDGNFERIFAGPITVEGGDGFQLTGFDNIQNAAHIDAVILDVTLPSAAVPEPASVAIWSLIGLGLAGFGVYRARRKK